MVIDPLTAPTWENKSYFDILRTHMYHLSDGVHKVAHIVNMVMDEMLSISNVVLQESQFTSDTVMKAILAVTNLIPETILDSKG